MPSKNEHLTRPDLAHVAAWGGRPTPPQVTILAWRPQRNAAGTMLGFVDIELMSGMQLYGCKVMVGPNGRKWVAPPATIRRDDVGNPILSDDGKPTWDQHVRFRDRDIRKRFEGQILAALRVTHPEIGEK